MPHWCAVPGCTNEHAEHRFPTNKQRKRQWEIAIKRKEKMVPRKERFGSPQNLTECAASTSLKKCNVRLETCLSA